MFSLLRYAEQMRELPVRTADRHETPVCPQNQHPLQEASFMDQLNFA